MGSVVRRGPGTWQLFFEVPRREDAPHERRRRSVLFRGAERAARKELARLELEAEAGRLVAGRLTCGALFDRYLKEHVALHKAPKTLRTYRYALAGTATSPAWVGGLRDVPVARLERGARHHLTALQARLRDEGRAPATVDVTFGALKAAFKWGADVGLVGRSPAAGFAVAAFTGELREERPSFTPGQARAYLEALPGSPWGLHLACLLLTNLRVSELRGLRWQDVDLERGRYQVVRQRYRIDGVEVLRNATKTPTSRRDGALPGRLVALLTDHKEALRRARMRAPVGAWRDPDGARGEGLALPCPTSGDGRPFSEHRLRWAHYVLLREAGLPRLHLHDLRHSWVTLSLAAGTPLHDVSRLAGHSSVAFTHRVYGHLLDDAAGRAAENLWALLKPPADARGERMAYEMAYRGRRRAPLPDRGGALWG